MAEKIGRRKLSIEKDMRKKNHSNIKQAGTGPSRRHI